MNWLSVFQGMSLWGVVASFVAAAAVICVAGTWLTRLADRLADRTGLGEAVTGAILLGVSTSLPGTITSMATAWDGRADLAFSNATGGIAAQTAFLALADLVYRRANLEHAAASAVNLTQAVLLIILLTIPLVAISTPEWTLFAIHPATPILLAAYIFGTRMSMTVKEQPMWQPRDTTATRQDQPEEEEDKGGSGTLALILQFVVFAAVLGIAGWVVARTGTQISERAGISETVVGALMTAIATSLPELVTTIMAVRRGALQLAVGGIIGGNTFDVLFLAAADGTYRDGSLYHAVEPTSIVWLGTSILMAAVLLLGLIRRERHGVANIGFESALLLAIYAAVAALSVVSGQGG